MSIIYSRPRLKLPKFVFYNNHSKRENPRRKRRVNLIGIVFVAFLTLKIVLDAIEPVFNTLCENKANSLATIISNKKTTEVMEEHTYDELFNIEKGEDGTVTVLKANVIPINKITSDIAVRIQEEINKQGREDIGIALRDFYWNKTFIWSWSYYSYKNFFNW